MRYGDTRKSGQTLRREFDLKRRVCTEGNEGKNKKDMNAAVRAVEMQLTIAEDNARQIKAMGEPWKGYGKELERTIDELRNGLALLRAPTEEPGEEFAQKAGTRPEQEGKTI